MTEFILDNSVLSAFHKIGRLKLLKDILKNHTVIVPDNVVRETKYPEIIDQIAFTRQQYSTKKWMLRVGVKSNKPIKFKNGEQAVLEVAAQRGGWAVIDDLKARKQAHKRRIKYAGTLTLLKHAREKKLITKTELRKIIIDLKEKDQFRMTKELEDWLLK